MVPSRPVIAFRLRGLSYEANSLYSFAVGRVRGLGLGYLGSQPPEGGFVIAARILTIYYFAHFLIVLPVLGLIERPKPLPSSITESVLAKSGAAAGSGV